MGARSRRRALASACAVLIGLAAGNARADGAERAIAALPFGAGQFQNGQVGLGIFFATAEGLLGGASIAAALVTQHLASTNVYGHGTPVDIGSLNHAIRTATLTNQFAFAGWAALTSAGVIEAQLSFAPRRRDRAEDRAASVSTTVTAAPVAGGGVVGVRVAF
jgi:hypothetical protein